MNKKACEIVFIPYYYKVEELTPGILVKELTGGEIGTIRFLSKDEVSLVSKKMLVENLLPVNAWIVSKDPIQKDDKALIQDTLIGTCTEITSVKSIKTEGTFASYRLSMGALQEALMTEEELKKVIATPQQIAMIRTVDGNLQNISAEHIKTLVDCKGICSIELEGDHTIKFVNDKVVVNLDLQL